MKRLALLVVGVAALASFTATAQSPQATAPHPAPTFAKDVASIMFNKCATCHRPGEVAPMSLLSYEDARPWAKAIKSKVVAREMPPWGADMSQSLPMRNDISLTQKEIDTIAAWVDGGAAKGNAAEMPPVPKFATGWTAGTEPDLDPAVRDEVDERRLLGQVQRMAQRRQRHGGAEPQPGRAGGDRGGEHERLRQVAVGEGMVLGEPGRITAERLGVGEPFDRAGHVRSRRPAGVGQPAEVDEQADGGHDPYPPCWSQNDRQVGSA